MACNWDKDLLKKLKQNPTAKNDLHDLYTSFWDIFRITQSERQTKPRIIINDYHYLKDYTFVEDYLIEMLRFPEITLQPYTYQKNISEDEVFDLIHDFYSHTNPMIFNTFKGVFDTRATHFRFCKSLFGNFYSGHTYISPSTGDCFIEAKSDGTISDAVIGTHEYGHVIDFFLNPYDQKPSFYNAFSEVSSIFFELIALDYWEIYQELKSDIQNERKIFYNSLIDDASILRDKFSIGYEVQDLIQNQYNYDPNFHKFFSYLKETLNLNRHVLNLILKNPAESLMPYTMSALIALELYHVYQTDPEFAFYLYHKLLHIKGRTAAELDDQINKLGIYPTQNIHSFTRKLSLNDDKN